MTFLFVSLYCLLTPTVFAALPSGTWLVGDYHVAEDLEVSAFVTIDRLEYDPSGMGVAYLDGTFCLYNFNEHRACSYDGELRLEILKPVSEGKWKELLPHRDEPVNGTLKKYQAPWVDISTYFSKSVSLNIDCLFPKPEVDEEYTMSAAITLNVYEQWGPSETWAVNSPTFKLNFTHNPVDRPGIGPTTDGINFSDDCMVDAKSEKDEDGDGVKEDDEWDNWQSLVITDGPYDVIYWYVKAPGDTSPYGEIIETDHGDGVKNRATMRTSFPHDIPGDLATYEITAYIYLSNNTVYSIPYNVWVTDRP